MSAARIEALLARARDERVFSAAAWSVGTADGELAGGVLGTRSWDGPALERSDLFDLASVTKPIAGLAVMALLEEGALTLGTTVGDLLPFFRGSTKEALTARDLMLHTSGLPGQVPMYRDHPTREAMLDGLWTLPPRRPPGEAVEYSSQGLMLLGMMAEAAASATLDVLVERYVAAPAGASSLLFAPGPGERERCVATEDCPWRGRVVTGEVHDENAVVLGGVAAHAGLFGGVDDLARLGRALLANRTERVLLHPATFAAMTRPRTAHLGEVRALTWQGYDDTGSPAGDLVGPATFGHTGFTGTSLFADPELGRYFVLLTNRVHPSRAGAGIVAVRRAFHNLAVLS